MSDNSSSTPEDFDASTSPASIESTNIEKSKSPSKTGAKVKKVSAEGKKGNVPEKGRNQ